MKARSLVLALVVAAGGHVACSLDLGREKHPAVTAFEAFYWKLQQGDLAAAGALVVPGSEAELALAAKRESNPVGTGVARGFELDVRHEADGDLSGRPAIRLHGGATVRVDPAGYTSAFGVPVPHEIEARLVQEGGSWRVAAFRDTVLVP